MSAWLLLSETGPPFRTFLHLFLLHSNFIKFAMAFSFLSVPRTGPYLLAVCDSRKPPVPVMAFIIARLLSLLPRLIWGGGRERGIPRKKADGTAVPLERCLVMRQSLRPSLLCRPPSSSLSSRGIKHNCRRPNHISHLLLLTRSSSPHLIPSFSPAFFTAPPSFFLTHPSPILRRTVSLFRLNDDEYLKMIPGREPRPQKLF